MKTKYECEICGFQSEDKKEVEDCEAQGGQPKFSSRQEVEYNYFTFSEGEWVKGRITKKITIQPRTHKVFYDLSRKDGSTRIHIESVPEERIRLPR